MGRHPVTRAQSHRSAPVALAHWSLRFDADPAAVAAALVALIETEGLALLTTTESANRRLLVELRKRLPAGYRAVRRFEYLIIWHAPTFAEHPAAWLAILDPRSWPMLGGRRLFRVARKRFTHRSTGRWVLVEAAHAPSGVDAGGGHWSHAHPDRVTISNHGFAAWGNRARRYGRRHPRAAQVKHLDSNLNQQAEAWRRFLERRLASPSIWSVCGVPDDGTEGSRLIDTAHVSLAVADARVLHPTKPPKLDHDPIAYRATF